MSHASVGAARFPGQKPAVGHRALVYFEDDPTDEFEAVIVRADEVDPHHVVLALDDGRFVLGSECHAIKAAPAGPGVIYASDYLEAFAALLRMREDAE